MFTTMLVYVDGNGDQVFFIQHHQVKTGHALRPVLYPGERTVGVNFKIIPPEHTANTNLRTAG